MDRRSFLTNMSAATVSSIAGAVTLSEKADALEEAMSIQLDKRIATPSFCNIDPTPEPVAGDTRPYYQHDDPRIPRMPEAPTLIDFYKLRFAPANHVLQSARLARNNGMEEKIIMACLLHDICVSNFIRTDHGYWCAQMVKPYVDEEVSWAIEVLVGMDLEARITAVKVLHYVESIRSLWGDFLATPGYQEQFAGKHVSEPFRVGKDIDGMARATITFRAMSKGIRNSARRVARAYL